MPFYFIHNKWDFCENVMKALFEGANDECVNGENRTVYAIFFCMRFGLFLFFDAKNVDLNR